MEYKTIKQIADELGVSKQAVHQKRKKEPLSTALQPFTSTVDGVVYISVDGIKLIKSEFFGNDRKPVVDNEPSTVYTPVYTPNHEIIEVLKETIGTLQKQLDIKDKQIEELTATVKNLSQSINADRHSELADKIAEAQETKLIEKKSNLIKKIFRKK